MVAKIFYDYYVRNYSQARIAEQCMISRQRVQRILSDDRYRGMVEVRINAPGNIHTSLEAELEDKFGVEEFIIVDARLLGDDPKTLNRELGQATAEYLMQVIADDMSVAVTWSKALLEMTSVLSRMMAASYKKFKGIKIIQSNGTLGEANPEYLSMEIAQRLGRIFHASLYLMPAPAMAANAESAKKFSREPLVMDTVEAFRHASMFLVGIGSMNHGESSVLRSHALSPEIEAELVREGAVGDINAYFFDAYGRPVASELERRTVGPTRSEVFGTERMVAVGGGSRKYEAVRGALRGKLAKVYICDYDSGRKLLKEK